MPNGSTGPGASAPGCRACLSVEQLAILSSRSSFSTTASRSSPVVDVMRRPSATPPTSELRHLVCHAERAIVLGDACTRPTILEPELTFVVDVDPELAKRTRAFIEQALLAPDTVAAASHFADPAWTADGGEGRSSWSFPASQVLPIAG